MARPFYIEVIESLNSRGVRFTIVGGVAAILHGAPRMTGDLDLAVVLDEQNLLRLVEAMAALGYRPKAPVEARTLACEKVREEWRKEKGMKVFTFVHPDKPFAEIDILIEQHVGFPGLWERRVEYKYGVVSIPTASIEDLIEMKSTLGRDKDIADISALRKVRALKEKEERGIE